MSKKEILFGLMVAVFLALVLSPFASPWPDGLEKVAEDIGFLEKTEAEPVLSSPIPDYAWPGIRSQKLATSAAGVAGTVVMFGLVYGIGLLLKKRQEI